MSCMCSVMYPFEGHSCCLGLRSGLLGRYWQSAEQGWPWATWGLHELEGPCVAKWRGAAGFGLAGLGPADTVGTGPAGTGLAVMGLAGIGPAGIGPAGLGLAGVDLAGSGLGHADTGVAGLGRCDIGPADSIGLAGTGVGSLGKVNSQKTSLGRPDIPFETAPREGQRPSLVDQTPEDCSGRPCQDHACRPEDCWQTHGRTIGH